MTIQIPSGAYAANLQWTEEEPQSQIPAAAAPEPAPPDPGAESSTVIRETGRVWLIAATCLILLGTLATIAVLRHMRSTDVVEGVWSPILESPRPAFICISQSVAYRPNSKMDSPVGPGDKMVEMPDAFVGTGDAFALADISKLLSTRGKDWQLIPGNSTPSQTLLAGPIILIGVHANKWTPAMTESLRFYFGIDNAIYDRSNPNLKWSLDHLSSDWKTNEDYALVSRFINPGSGQPVIVIAGLTNAGTEAAGEFLTNRDLLAEALRNATGDWQHRNFQFVLHTKIIGNTPITQR